MAQMTVAEEKVRKSDLAQIHSLAHLLRLNDEVYRDMLYDLFGVRSSAALKRAQRYTLIQTMRGKLGPTLQRHIDLSKRHETKATPAQLRAIEAMWSVVSRAETPEMKKVALDSFCETLVGVRFLRWIDKDDAKKLIRAIEAMEAQKPEDYNKQHNTTEASHG